MKLNMPEPEPESTEMKNEETPTTVTRAVDNAEPPPAREMSQTDHLNKQLLTSLFKRMDENGDSLLSKMLEDDEVTECDDAWE